MTDHTWHRDPRYAAIVAYALMLAFVAFAGFAIAEFVV